MKITILYLFLLATLSVSAQNTSHYKKVYAYDEYHTNWALVKSIAGTYGFIDRNGKEIVPAIYDKIYPFEEAEKDKSYAMVKNVAGAYGFIDDDGKEVVKAIYFDKEEAIQKLNSQK